MGPSGPGIPGDATLVQWEDRLARLLRAREQEGVTLRHYWSLSIRIKVLTFFITRYADVGPVEEWTEVDEAPPPAESPMVFEPRGGPRRPPRSPRRLRPILERIAEANRSHRTELRRPLPWTGWN